MSYSSAIHSHINHLMNVITQTTHKVTHMSQQEQKFTKFTFQYNEGILEKEKKIWH